MNERARIALETNLEKYRTKLDGQDKIVEVSPEIGVPILEKLTYVTDEELSDLYIKLLAKASMVDTAHFAHPSFAHLINNLSPDEAKLLKEFRTRNSVPFIAAEALAKMSKRIRAPLARLWQIVSRVWNLKFPFRSNRIWSPIFSNFERLGLLAIRRGIVIANASLYEDLQKVYRHTSRIAFEQMRFDQDHWLLTFRRGKIDVTDFGRLFIDACLTKVEPDFST